MFKNLTQLSDAELIRLGNKQNSKALEELYHRYKQFVYSRAFYYLRNEADALDVSQEVFSAFMGKFPGFILVGKVTTFLFPLIRNQAVMLIRKKKMITMEQTEHIIDETICETYEDDLEPYLKFLNNDQREIFLLRFIENYSLSEISDLLDTPLNTIKSRINKGLEKIRENFK